jgi:hypothetical protein
MSTVNVSPYHLRSKDFRNSSASRELKQLAHQERVRKTLSPSSIPFYCMDVESTFDKRTNTRIVYQIAFKKSYWYGNRVKPSKSVDSTIVIDILEGVLNNDEMKKSIKYNKRLIAGQNYAHQNPNTVHLRLNFEFAINMILNMCAGTTLVTYSLNNDIGILRSFQDYLNTNGYSINIMGDPKWKNFNKVCARSLIFNYCPNSVNFIHEFENLNPNRLTKKENNYGTKLEDLVSCFKNDPDYEQSHSSVHDTDDLFFVLQCVAKKDGCPLNGTDHLEKVENIKCNIHVKDSKIPKETTTWNRDNSNDFGRKLQDLYDKNLPEEDFAQKYSELKEKFR